MGKCQKVQKFDFQRKFSMSKIIGIFLIFKVDKIKESFFFWNYLTGLEVPELTRDRSHHWPLLDRNYPSPNWHLPNPQSNFLVLHCTLLPNTAGLVKILLLAPVGSFKLLPGEV